ARFLLGCAFVEMTPGTGTRQDYLVLKIEKAGAGRASARMKVAGDHRPSHSDEPHNPCHSEERSDEESNGVRQG
ncbi:hypothetical protein JW777_09980, partial [bacterium]|nr:hypothetical protein [bacterium]